MSSQKPLKRALLPMPPPFSKQEAKVNRDQCRFVGVADLIELVGSGMCVMYIIFLDACTYFDKSYSGL